MQPNDKIGPYKIVFLLKKGYYAETYRVVDESGNKRVLKLFNLAKLSEKQYSTSITDLNEVAIVKTLKHPNTLSYIDSGECIVDGQRFVYLVCDFIIGETLLDKIKREGICSVYDVRQITIGILNAIKSLHHQNSPIIHNAITPDNIMLDMSTNSVQAKLIGYGHAQILDSRNRALFADGLNPFYMAPELYKGLYSTRTDLYAVGVMMYHLIFGIAPWYIDLSKVSIENRTGAILNERKQPIKIPNINIFELDDNLLNTIVKATNQDVDKRFQNADEFLRALTGDDEVEKGTYNKVNIESQKTDSVATPTIKKGNGFSDVAGMDKVKERFQNEIIDLIQYPEKYKKLRVTIPNGALLYGPPGCGKTFFAEKFAEEIGWNYMYVHCSDVASPYIHGGQEKIADLFQQAKDNAPTILFLDEIDAMLADRSRHNNVSEYGEVNEFLTHLNNCADNQIFVIGATNNPQGIDSAALRSGRLEMKIYIPAPDDSEREKLLKLYLKGRCATDIDYNELVRLTTGYVSKDISSLVNKAARLAGKLDKENVSMAELKAQIEQSKEQGELPSVSAQEIKQHEAIRDRFEGRKSSRPHVGFVPHKDE
jgi:transitional endoplasmic reticulum ATPase